MHGRSSRLIDMYIDTPPPLSARPQRALVELATVRGNRVDVAVFQHLQSTPLNC